MTTRSKPTSFFVAAAIVLLAILLFDIMGAIIKHLGSQYPAPQMSMYRNLFGLLPTLLILWWSREWNNAGRPVVIRQWKLALGRGGFVVLAQMAYYLALSRMEFATVTTLAFAGPLFVTALSIPMLGHRVGPWRWLAVLIGFTGVVLVMRPTASNFNWLAVLPLLAAFGYASLTVSSKLFDDSVSTALINLYSNIGALIGSVVLLAVTGEYVTVASATDWMWIMAMGVAGGLGVFCLITAYRLGNPSSLSPFEYFGIPFSFVLGWIFFAEAPFDRLIPGVFLIVGGGLVIVWREHSARQSDTSASSGS